MACIKRLVLDVLKPHQPNALEFSTAIAESGPGLLVKLVVVEMDERTETLVLEIQGPHVDFDRVQQTIENLGGSLHSIDEVEVASDDETGTPRNSG